MLDIHFYMKSAELKKQLMSRKSKNKQYVIAKLEEFRSKEPFVYNIETTNACNMRCEMCPRTTMMTRSVETLDMKTYRKVIAQIRPFSDIEWQRWENFVEEYYHISRNGMSENHFFLFIIPRVTVLHGYGDPLLDKKMPERIRLLSERNIPTYFSCNPANIDLDKTMDMFENGLNYIKYSIESVDDTRHKQIRGNASNFTDSYKKILKLIEIKEKRAYKTTIIITMLNLSKPWQEDDFERLRDAFKDLDVYIYLKSQDQQWYQNKSEGTESIHWLEFCQFPWSSMTIKSNGEAIMCVEDFNNEIFLGDVKEESLYDIWNGEKYRKFRQDHFDLTRGIKCTEQCDMNLIGSLIKS